MNPRALLVGLGATLVIALGALAFRDRLGDTTTQREPLQAVDPDLGALRVEIGRLTREMADLRIALEKDRQLEAPDVLSRTPVDSGLAQQAADMASAARDLHSILTALQSGPLAVEKPRSQRNLMDLAPASVPDSVFSSLETLSEVDRDLTHLGWSFEQVIEKYGRPSRSGPSPGGGGLKWYYARPNGVEVIFWFQDDKVVRVFQ